MESGAAADPLAYVITYNDGRPGMRQPIKLTMKRGIVKSSDALYRWINSVYTDSIGNFEFRNVQPGSYYVAISGDGFQPTRQMVDVFGNGGGITTVTVFLERLADAKTAAKGVDAADPDIIDITQLKENFPKKAVQNYDKATDEVKKGHDANAIKLLEEAVQMRDRLLDAATTQVQEATTEVERSRKDLQGFAESLKQAQIHLERQDGENLETLRAISRLLEKLAVPEGGSERPESPSLLPARP